MIFAFALSYLLTAISAVLLILVWWPLRKTDALRSLPWIFGMTAISMISGAIFRLFLPGPKSGQILLPETAELITSLSTAAILIGSCKTFLCALLLIINATALLDRAGYTSTLIKGLGNLYPKTRSFGIALLVVTLISSTLFPILFSLLCSQS